MSTLEKFEHRIPAKEERLWPRRRCNYMTNCHDTYGRYWSCNIVDISGNGLGIVSSTVLRQGQIINLAEPRTKARIIWVAEGRAGLRICN